MDRTVKVSREVPVDPEREPIHFEPEPDWEVQRAYTSYQEPIVKPQELE